MRDLSKPVMPVRLSDSELQKVHDASYLRTLNSQEIEGRLPRSVIEARKKGIEAVLAIRQTKTISDSLKSDILLRIQKRRVH